MSEPTPILVVLGANDPGPTLTLETRCGACGVVVVRREIDVQVYLGDGGRDGAADAEAWLAHRCGG